MKIFLLALLFLFLMLSNPASLLAQETAFDTKADSDGYKLAAGLSYTAIHGNETSFKAKYFVERMLGLEAQAGLFTEDSDNAYQLYLAFVWQPYLPGMGLLRPYLGIGPAANVLYAKHNTHSKTAFNTALIGVIPYGLEYSFADIPVAVSFDCKIPFVKLNEEHLRQATANNTVGFGAKLLLR